MKNPNYFCICTRSILSVGFPSARGRVAQMAPRYRKPLGSPCLTLWSLLAVAFALLAGSLRAEVLYIANEGGIFAYRIAGNGTLTPVAGSPFSGGFEPSSMAVDALGRFLYETDTSSDRIFAYRIAANGALTPVAGSPFPGTGTAPYSIAVDPFDRFLYTLDTYLPPSDDVYPPGTISAYNIAANGSLTPVAGSPFSTGFGPTSLVMDPFGRFLYVANGASFYASQDTVSGYYILGNGALMPLPGSPYPDGPAPVDIAVDPFGRFIYTTDFFFYGLSAYQIANNGALQELADSPFMENICAGAGNVVVAADPLGRFVYVAAYMASPQLQSGVYVFRVSQNTLTQVTGSPFSSYPGDMAADLFGRFLYTTTYKPTPGIAAYSIGETGALAPLSGSPFQISPGLMAISPDHMGKHTDPDPEGR